MYRSHYVNVKPDGHPKFFVCTEYLLILQETEVVGLDERGLHLTWIEGQKLSLTPDEAQRFWKAWNHDND
jgi:hypothetical protein